MSFEVSKKTLREIRENVLCSKPGASCLVEHGAPRQVILSTVLASCICSPIFYSKFILVFLKLESSD